MPTQTLYATDSGILFIAKLKSHTLISMVLTVHTDGHKRVKPAEYFKPIAQQNSNTPAITKMTHGELKTEKFILYS